jgi:class 3 adenylate cyclase
LNAAAVNYRPRLVGWLLIAAMLVGVPDERTAGARYAIAGFGLAWPHLAYWLASRSGDHLRAERINILVDSFLGGVLAVAFSLRLWPTSAAYTMGFLNLLLTAGPRFLGMGIGASIAGFAVAWPAIGLRIHLDAEPMIVALSILGIFSYVVLAGSTAYRLRLRQRELRIALEREERKSHELLVNVFPDAVVPRLRSGESPIADQFADVTVVFADIVEFTPLAERLGPKRTVLLLNDLFRRFDQAAARFGVEKIETTGDGYLAVAGAPRSLDDHPAAAADFALEAVEAARALDVPLRVGIHTGPIFAGVIGESRFHYKVFGDTVNRASRLQGHAQPGRVLVSDACSKRIAPTHVLEARGTVELKGHGPMPTSWLLSRRH